jgi:hypothetical protein
MPSWRSCLWTFRRLVKYVIRCLLGLRGCYYDQPFVAPEFTQPALDVSHLVLENNWRDSRLGTQKRRAHLSN